MPTDLNRELAELIGEEWPWVTPPMFYHMCGSTVISMDTRITPCPGCGYLSVKEPLDFLHDDAAAWKLICYLKRFKYGSWQNNALEYFINYASSDGDEKRSLMIAITTVKSMPKGER